VLVYVKHWFYRLNILIIAYRVYHIWFKKCNIWFTSGSR